MRSLRARPVRIDEQLALVAIEAVESHERRSDNGCGFFVNVEPVAVVICGAEPVRALDMRGSPVDVDRLERDVPSLGSMLGAINPFPGSAR